MSSKQIFGLIILIFLTACVAPEAVSALPTPSLSAQEISSPEIEQAPVDQPAQHFIWTSSTPEAQGVDSRRLVQMLEEIQQEAYTVDSVMVLRNGTVLLDAAVYPFPSDQTHVIHSCTKSIVSALIGIAIEQGYIDSIETPVLDFFPAYSPQNLDADKQSMQLRDLLTMSSGMDCRDSYLHNWRGLDDLWASEDWVAHILGLPMSEPPGERFEYCNSASFLLSAILQETTGMKASQYAEQVLFGPLGITDYEWRENPQGFSIGWGDLHLRPQDMAKIGQLYLDGGVWDGQQIVPAAWVEESTRQQVPSFTLQEGYGYQWWIDHDGFYLALGYRGQFIFVVPEQELVVVFTSDLDDQDFYIPENLLKEYIIPAARASEPLPENPDSVERLQALKEALCEP